MAKVTTQIHGEVAIKTGETAQTKTQHGESLSQSKRAAQDGTTQIKPQDGEIKILQTTNHGAIAAITKIHGEETTKIHGTSLTTRTLTVQSTAE